MVGWKLGFHYPPSPPSRHHGGPMVPLPLVATLGVGNRFPPGHSKYPLAGRVDRRKSWKQLSLEAVHVALWPYVGREGVVARGQRSGIRRPLRSTWLGEGRSCVAELEVMIHRNLTLFGSPLDKDGCPLDVPECPVSPLMGIRRSSASLILRSNESQCRPVHGIN
jgi:hypothetical protein